MRKLFIPLMVLGLTAGLSSISYAELALSAHDFSAEAWNPGAQLCQPCHTPHNADTTVTESPLWNHEVTVAAHTPYSGPGTLDATVGSPAGVSLLCLSCHDGTVALDSFGGDLGSTVIGAEFSVGTDLSNDHPISFTYNAALATADGELFDPETVSSGLGGTIEADMLFGTAGSATLECASCHDVHNTVSAANPSLLLKSNVGSALCLTCHDK